MEEYKEIALRRGTLQDRALIAATEDIFNLRDLLVFCNARPSNLASCEAAGEFWKYSIAKILGKWIVLERRDLQGDDWYHFAKLLVTGITYNYAMREDLVNDTWNTNPVPYDYIFDKEEAGNDIAFYEIPIRAVLPTAGMKGYFVRQNISVSKSRGKDLYKFIIGPNMDENFLLAAQLLAENYYNYHIKETLQLNKFVDFFTDDIYHDDTGIRNPFPTIDTLQQIVIDNGINPATGRGRGPLWFVYSGAIDAYYTETFYEIIPVTF
jgi:hypothetical protein